MSRAMPCDYRSNANRHNYGENEGEAIKIINNISLLRWFFFYSFLSFHSAAAFAAVWMHVRTVTLICIAPLSIAGSWTTVNFHLYIIFFYFFEKMCENNSRASNHVTTLCNVVAVSIAHLNWAWIFRVFHSFASQFIVSRNKWLILTNLKRFNQLILFALRISCEK